MIYVKERKQYTSLSFLLLKSSRVSELISPRLPPILHSLGLAIEHGDQNMQKPAANRWRLCMASGQALH